MRILILLLIFLTSCQKEFSFSAPPINEITLTIKAETFYDTPNGNSGYYWRTIMSSSKEITLSYNAVYICTVSDGSHFTINHNMLPNSTKHITSTNYLASSQHVTITKIELVRVDGANNYIFKLKT